MVSQLASGIFLMTLVVDPAKLVTVDVAVVTRYGPDTGRTNSGSTFENVASAVTLAIEDYQASGRLTNVTFRIINQFVTCRLPGDFGTFINLYYQKKPNVIIGLICSTVMIPLDRYLSYWNVAHFPMGGMNSILADKSVYTTLVRVQATGDKTANAFVSMFKKYGWRRAAMVTDTGGCDLSGTAIYNGLRANGVTITEWIRPIRGFIEDYLLEDYLDRVRERARIIIECLGWSNHDRFLLMAYEKGMRAPDFVFINYGITPGQSTYEPWIRNYEDRPDYWRQILIDINYKMVRVAGIRGQEVEDFYDRVPVRLTQPPWNFNMSLENGWRGGIRAADLYDATMAYLTALHDILEDGGDWRDGGLIQKTIFNKVVYGLHGKMLFDDKADREADYWIFDIKQGEERYEERILISMAEPPEKRFVPIENGYLVWGTKGNIPTPDTPACGFQNELCSTGPNVVLIASSTGGGMLLLLIGFCLIIQRRRRLEEEALQQTVWKVNFAEIQTQGKRTGSVANMSQRSMKSEGSNASDGIEQQMSRQLFTEVGTYRGNLVAILKVEKLRVDLAREDLKEMKAMKDMSHDNLAVFVGACVEAPNVCYIMHYYTKGSLQDIIDNEVIGLDWMFKTSLLSDLAKGVAYLHRSELGSHGSLKSSCCLVDSRWQLKISSYGLHAFRTGKAVSDYQMHRKLLWTSPELLRMPRHHWPRYGTQKGDVYSFGVIAQEVIYRTSPHFIDLEPPEEIIAKIKKSGARPYRPELPKVDDDTPKEAVNLIETCWAEDPAARPTFSTISNMITNLNKGRKVDIMSSLIEKLEKYANNLEDIVNKRTAELVIEKKKADILLYSMIPESVVEELKHGRTVEAELFEAVTIYFSDIVGFTALSLESSPIEIVNLLNDLYTMFDDIINLHDVYKVETIGDSYMVVSGLPRRNGDSHVGAVADLALDLMNAALRFRIRHRPGSRLQLRVGFHTGPCAAGVVGLSMPRYCLFGDTVNMASRMETNGKALMIHMSRYAFAALDKLGGYSTKPRGEMQIKGKGLQMTYWLVGKDRYNKPLPDFLTQT